MRVSSARSFFRAAPGRRRHKEVAMSKVVTIGATALFACVLCATPLSLRLSPEGIVSLSWDSASAVIGRPLTPLSVAGVHRRAERRAYRRGYYGYGGYNHPYRYSYGTYRPYNYNGSGYGTYQPYSYSGSGYGPYRPRYGYAYQPYGGYGYSQQPYYGYGNRQWWQF